MTNYFIDQNTGDILTLNDLKANYEQIAHFGFYEDAFNRSLPAFNAWVEECLAAGEIRKMNDVTPDMR
jgi:hypothetical protein